MADSARKSMHDLVDQLSDQELATAKVLLRALKDAVPSEQLEDALDSHDLRRLRNEQDGDELESLDAFGKRVGLE